MRGLFRGWKRKVGVVTLLMAVLLIVGWIRSYLVCDTVNIQTGPFTVQFISSVDALLMWMGIDGRKSWVVPKVHFWETTDSYDLDQNGLNHESRRLDWHNSAVYNFSEQWYTGAEEPPIEVEMAFWIFPYWSIVLPLTLLSAYLLLGKPRRATAMKTSEPASAEAR